VSAELVVPGPLTALFAATKQHELQQRRTS
jgi:hypothetical protein